MHTDKRAIVVTEIVLGQLRLDAFQQERNKVVFRSEDAATNRLWLRMRVEIPAEPAVVLASMCSCEFYLNGVRIGATGDLDLPRPAASTRVHSFVVPASIPPGPALLAVRQYHPPGIEAIIPFHFQQAIRVAESRRAVEVAQAISDARTLRSHIRLALFLLALGSVLAASAGVREKVPPAGTVFAVNVIVLPTVTPPAFSATSRA